MRFDVRDERGFTLLEAIVVVVLVILLAVLIVVFGSK